MLDKLFFAKFVDFSNGISCEIALRGPYWWVFITGSDNGLVTSGNKALPKLVLA